LVFGFSRISCPPSADVGRAGKQTSRATAAHVRVLPRAQRRASRRSSTCTDVLSIRNSLPSAAELVARMYRSNVAFKQLKHASESPTRLFSACTCFAGLSYSMNVLRRSHAPYIRMPLLRRFLAATSTADGFFDRRTRDALQTYLRASSVNRRTIATVQFCIVDFCSCRTRAPRSNMRRSLSPPRRFLAATSTAERFFRCACSRPRCERRTNVPLPAPLPLFLALKYVPADCRRNRQKPASTSDGHEMPPAPSTCPI